MAPRRLSTLLILAVLWAVPVGAADTPAPPPSARPATPPATPPAAPSPDTPGEQARRGLDLLMKALEGLARQMPLYAPPEVTPEGDIIIRRLDRNRPPPPESPSPGSPSPKTPAPRPPVPNAPPSGTPGSPTDL